MNQDHPLPSKLVKSRIKPPNAGKGRKAGTPNKTTALLKDAILQAAEQAGGDKNGLVGYLAKQATANPGPFMALLGKVLPMQITGDPANPLEVNVSNMSTADRARALAAFVAKTKAEK